MKHKKRLFWLLLLPVLLIPVHVHMTDGGSEGWHAILWQLDHCHEFSKNGFLVGTRVSLLFGLIPVYDDTHEEPMTPETKEADTPAETRTDTPKPTAANAPELVGEESFFSDFAVQDNLVFFLCRLTVRNPSEMPMVVKIEGDFSEDAKGGLVLGKTELALQLDDKEAASFLALGAEEQQSIVADRERQIFLLQPGENRFWVVFYGLHGESSQKQNRLLPPLSVRPLTEVTPEAVLEETGCRIFKDPGPDAVDAVLLDGEGCCMLGDLGLGGYGLTSVVPWDYDGNGVSDLLFTYSWGSGMHRSHLVLFDRTSREERDLYVYYPRDYDSSVFGEDLLVERVTDESGTSYTVYTVDVVMDDWNYADLRFTKRAEAGFVAYVQSVVGGSSGAVFWPDGDFLSRSDATVEESFASTLFLDPTESDGFVCEVEIGGETVRLQGETAEKLYRICGDIMEQGELISSFSIPALDSKPPLSLAFRVIPPSGTPEDADFSTYSGTFWVYPDFECDYAMLSPSPYASLLVSYRLPAGTYDALIEALGEAG